MELSEKKLKKLYEKNLKILHELSKLKGNKSCADCLATSPKWASANLGVFLCIKCAGYHKKMGSGISIVKSITLDNWTQDEIQVMIDGGNEKSNLLYLNGSNKPLEADYDYIRDKYERRIFSKSFSKAKSEKSEKDSLSILENMGFTKKATNLKALELADGDVQNAIELLLAGAVGEGSSQQERSRRKSNETTEGTQDFNLPKLPIRNGISQESVADSTISLHAKDIKMPDRGKEKISESRDEIQEKKENMAKMSQEEKIKQAMDNALEQLASFGFTDATDTRTALRQARGDVEKALGILIKWKEERATKENTYKEQKKLDESKKSPLHLSEKPNLLGSLDNIGPSVHSSNNTHSHHSQFQAISSFKPQQQEFDVTRTNGSAVNSQSTNSVPIAMSTTFNQPSIQAFPANQNVQLSQPSQEVSPQIQPFAQQQNPIDILSDQFGFPTSIQSQPIQPTIKTIDLLGSSNNNPFAGKPILPTVPAKLPSNNIFDNPTANSIASKQTVSLSNDLAGLSFGAAPAMSASSSVFGGHNTTTEQNLTQTFPIQNKFDASIKPSKDTIMSLYGAAPTNQATMHHNPFALNQQQQMAVRSQPRMSLTKTVNANPFMNAVPNLGGSGFYPTNIVGSNNMSYQMNSATPNNASPASYQSIQNQRVPNDTSHFGRNYQLDNYSASAVGVSEIFSATPPQPSEKDRIQASLFSDLTSFRR